MTLFIIDDEKIVSYTKSQREWQGWVSSSRAARVKQGPIPSPDGSRVLWGWEEDGGRNCLCEFIKGLKSHLVMLFEAP